MKDLKNYTDLLQQIDDMAGDKTNRELAQDLGKQLTKTVKIDPVEALRGPIQTAADKERLLQEFTQNLRNAFPADIEETTRTQNLMDKARQAGKQVAKAPSTEQLTKNLPTNVGPGKKLAQETEEEILERIMKAAKITGKVGAKGLSKALGALMVLDQPSVQAADDLAEIKMMNNAENIKKALEMSKEFGGQNYQDGGMPKDAQEKLLQFRELLQEQERQKILDEVSKSKRSKYPSEFFQDDLYQPKQEFDPNKFTFRDADEARDLVPTSAQNEYPKGFQQDDVFNQRKNDIKNFTFRDADTPTEMVKSSGNKVLKTNSLPDIDAKVAKKITKKMGKEGLKKIAKYAAVAGMSLTGVIGAIASALDQEDLNPGEDDQFIQRALMQQLTDSGYKDALKLSQQFGNIDKDALDLMGERKKVKQISVEDFNKVAQLLNTKTPKKENIEKKQDNILTTKSQENTKEQPKSEIPQDIKDPMGPPVVQENSDQKAAPKEKSLREQLLEQYLQGINKQPEVSPEDQKALENARTMDGLAGLLNTLDTAFAQASAANPNAIIQPVKGAQFKGGREDRLQKQQEQARKLAQEAEQNRLKGLLGVSKEERISENMDKQLEIAKERLKSQKDLQKRKENLELKKAELKLKLQNAKSDKDRNKLIEKYTRDIRNDVTKGEKGKLFGAYTTANRVATIVDKFRQNPTGFTDYAALMNALKMLQGDDSVVREAEMRLGQEAQGLFNRMKNFPKKITSGQTLDDKMRKDIIDAAVIMSNSGKEAYIKSIQPDLNHAKELGIPLSKIIGEDLNTKQIIKKSLKDKKTGKEFLNNVTIKRKRDGKQITLSRDKAQKYLKSPDFEEVK